MFKLLLFSFTTIWDFVNPFLMLSAPFIMQFIKNVLKLQGNGAVIMIAVVSGLMSLLGAWATGMFAMPMMALATAIFTAATLIYKFFMTNETVQAKLPTVLSNRPQTV